MFKSGWWCLPKILLSCLFLQFCSQIPFTAVYLAPACRLFFHGLGHFESQYLPGQISSTLLWPCSPSISCCFFSFAPFFKWSNHKWDEACRIKINMFAAAHWLKSGRCMEVWNAASVFHQLVFFSTQPIPPRILGNLLVERKFCFFSLVNWMEAHKVFSTLEYTIKVPVVVERTNFRFALQFGRQ